MPTQGHTIPHLVLRKYKDGPIYRQPGEVLSPGELPRNLDALRGLGYLRVHDGSAEGLPSGARIAGDEPKTKAKPKRGRGRPRKAA